LEAVEVPPPMERLREERPVVVVVRLVSKLDREEVRLEAGLLVPEAGLLVVGAGLVCLTGGVGLLPLILLMALAPFQRLVISRWYPYRAPRPKVVEKVKCELSHTPKEVEQS
jgi:hypothetical protein